jgi:hypothetical protein
VWRCACWIHGPKLCSPNGDFGRRTVQNWGEFYPLPNEDFGRSDETFQNAFPGEALFKGMGTRFGRKIVEKCFPGKRILKRSFSLPKSSFGEHKFNPPKRRIWKDEQKMTSGVSKHFRLGHEPLKSQSKLRMSSFVRPSKFFVWGLNGEHKVYPSQTKILEGRTNISERVSPGKHFSRV